METDTQSIDFYDFELDEELIAQHPADRRDGSRLLVVGRKDGSLAEDRFDNIATYLPKDALIVANNSRVLPARVKGKRPTGGAVEFLLLTPLPLIKGNENESGMKAEAMGLVRSSKRLGPGETASFGRDMDITVLERLEFGRCRVLLSWKGNLADVFAALGEMPLPPYIHRPGDTEEDRDRYQTVYARVDKTGSVAAPTAGLHFTPELKEELLRRGHDWAEITLYVGYGTFSPVRVHDITEHVMHGEYVEIGPHTADRIMKAKAEGRPVVAVGTTTVRSLEGAHAATGRIAPFSGWTDIYIRPGFDFKVVDGMITNFHLPKSSLIIMVSAFAGCETIKRAYEKAVRDRFRFFSYGDSMLIA